MTSPYAVTGPAVISFSGGRTSAFMLRQVLDYGLQPDVHVLFANTGKERPETLDFIKQIERHWPVEIHWLERRPYARTSPFADRYTVVDYRTADRDGLTFLQLVTDRHRLPNPRIRFCTTELKIRVMKHWMMARGYKYWDMIIGLRADEPRRVANQRKQNSPNKERWTRVMPMADAGHTLAHVESFWAAQSFALQLAPHEGNCDLCFLKSLWKKQQIAKDRPDLVPWWSEREAVNGQPFRIDQPAYKLLTMIPQTADACESEQDCACTD